MASPPASSLTSPFLSSGAASSAVHDPPLLVLERVTKAFGRGVALRDVSLALPRGSCLLLLGPNGAGKTTLLRIAAGLSRPTAGRLLVEGSAGGAPERLRRGLGYVAHQTLLYDALTARQNLVFFARLYGIANPHARASGLLERFGLARHADRSVASFSRGMQQRLALARALVHDPSLLILDEPASGLDADGAGLLRETLADSKRAGATILVATHLIEGVTELADQVAILARGELRHSGPTAGLSAAGLAALLEATLGGRQASAPAGAVSAAPAGAEAPSAPDTASGRAVNVAPPVPGRAVSAAPHAPGRALHATSRAAWRLRVLLAKDLLVEWRRKQQVVAMGIFAFLAAILFVFAVDPLPAELSRLAPGALWISFLFAGTLGLAKVFAPEERHDALTALLVAPVDRTSLFLGKAVSAAVFMGLMEALMTPVFFALFDLPLLPILGRFTLVAGLATAGFCLLGTLLAFATSRAAARELLLPLLLLSLSLPLLIAAAKATRILLEGPAGAWIADYPLWLSLMLAFDVVFGVLCAWGFERAVEE